MIHTIKLTRNKFRSLPKGFQWKDIPKFAVITGINGSGKTQLLELINTAIRERSNKSCVAEAEFHPGINNKHKAEFVPITHSLNDLGTGNASSLENMENAFFTYLKRDKNNPNSYNPGYEKLIEYVEEKTKCEVTKLEDDEIKQNFPGDWMCYMHEGFNNNYIATLFKAYLDKKRDVALEAHNKQEVITEDELLEKIGEAPWDIINSLFEEYKFHYRIKKPGSYKSTYTPFFQDISNTNSIKEDINFNQLSGGEKIIVSLILWAYNNILGVQNKLFLFDEFDAHLHPAMSKMFIEVLTDVLVDKFGIQVILTTHNPSTVVHVPEDALYWMERGESPRKTAIDEVVSILADGIATVTETGVTTRIAYTLKTINEPVIFVEGITDKMILEEVWAKLYPDSKKQFYIQDAFDCHFIMNSFRRENLFKNYPDRTFIGLLDYKGAYGEWNKKCKEKSNKYIKMKQEDIYRHETDRGAVLFLPVPSFRKTYAGNGIKNPTMSIEHLFKDDIISGFCKTDTHPGGGKTLEFKEKFKDKFATKIVPGLSVEQCECFRPLFDILTTITAQGDTNWFNTK